MQHKQLLRQVHRALRRAGLGDGGGSLAATSRRRRRGHWIRTGTPRTGTLTRAAPAPGWPSTSTTATTYVFGHSSG